ncbi:YbaB/EbfC family nucleoid-associated protein [Thermobifida halotolerans]|uniref:Nucleoid-associated protein NI17_020330 n=1 Tax=Thermobifida halotolerans TaxID=483545 RepID=A0A399FU38_9ACTN|nr:YbaB/EbfC family nucleoid-associated protein [Thermobifida halotolerans]UOE22161.1 YbaB/EbfC family nucleoid-associated protein [Thermobifida halotolerans]
MDMQAILQQAQQMQQQLMAAQQELDEAKLQGTSGGGLVTVTMNGRGQVEDITIDPGAVDPGDASDTAQTIADLVLAAIRDAERMVEELQQQKMGPLAQGMGGGIPGLPGF